MNMAKKRPNIVPIIEDARHPQKYRMLVPMVDVIFADVAQPDQVREGAEQFGTVVYSWAYTRVLFKRQGKGTLVVVITALM